MGVAVQERFLKPGPSNSLGVGIPNSVRAMLRVPDFYEAWMGGGSPRPAAPLVPRTILLQVSLAVSKVNGCRYCTVHQIVGLRKQGVEIGKLLSLDKNDDALSPEEKAAVTFARKLSKSPGALTEADRAALQSAFPGKAAFEVLQQTCRFAFMNRFTDTLGLPSEDEAVHIYREVFGEAAQKVKK
jgi:alkylhydroperoxidase family enzyme